MFQAVDAEYEHPPSTNEWGFHVSSTKTDVKEYLTLTIDTKVIFVVHVISAL